AQMGRERRQEVAQETEDQLTVSRFFPSLLPFVRIRVDSWLKFFFLCSMEGMRRYEHFRVVGQTRLAKQAAGLFRVVLRFVVRRGGGDCVLRFYPDSGRQPLVQADEIRHLNRDLSVDDGVADGALAGQGGYSKSDQPGIRIHDVGRNRPDSRPGGARRTL